MRLQSGQMDSGGLRHTGSHLRSGDFGAMESEKEKDLERDWHKQTEPYKRLGVTLDTKMYLMFVFYLVTDVLGVSASLLDSFCC